MSHLKVGDKAPSFAIETDSEGKIKLSDFKDQKNVVLYFYPKDSTPGCTKEACAFSDAAKNIAGQDAVVIGISPDSVASHAKFREKYKLKVILGADESKELCEKYGVWAEKSMYGKKYFGVVRSTFIIDKKGKIAAIWPNVKVAGHDAEVLKTLKEINI